jgi:hypothetical protein
VEDGRGGVRQKLCGSFLRNAAGSKRLREGLDACREAVGPALQAVVSHDNAEASLKRRTFLWMRTEYPGAPMRRILLSCVSAAVLLLPAAASAGAPGHGKSRPGYLVVRRAAGDGRIDGAPVVTLVVHGFVLGRVSTIQEARVDIYHLASGAGDGGAGPQVVGDVLRKTVRWRHVPGKEYSGSGFRFRVLGGYNRVVVRGAGIYLFAGGRGNVKLRGSSFDRNGDGTYAIDDAAPRSLPTRMIRRELGRG